MNPVLSLLAAALLSGAASASTMLDQGRFVSMGSSYAAGPGVGLPDPTAGGCQRSLSNYARIVAARRHLPLVDVSCSGATTDNILLHGQYGFPPQIEAVTADTQLVSILIGGNDIAYVRNLFDLSCRSTAGLRCPVVDDGEVDRRLAALPNALDAVVRAVRARAPSARIVLVGYLPAVAATGPCAALPLAPADASRMRLITTRLEAAIADAAARNGARLVNASAIGKAHDACARRPFIAGFHPARNPAWKAPIAYHPTQAGMTRLATTLDKAIGR